MDRVKYPALVAETAKRKLSKKEMARGIGICEKSFRNKLDGKTPFTLEEAMELNRKYFPDMGIRELFATSEERR